MLLLVHLVLLPLLLQHPHSQFFMPHRQSVGVLALPMLVAYMHVLSLCMCEQAFPDIVLYVCVSLNAFLLLCKGANVKIYYAQCLGMSLIFEFSEKKHPYMLLLFLTLLRLFCCCCCFICCHTLLAYILVVFIVALIYSHRAVYPACLIWLNVNTFYNMQFIFKT